MKLLVTGSAGFIGFHVVNRLLLEGHEVIGLDSINDYYQVGLKYDRLIEAGVNQRNIGYNRFSYSERYANYRFIKLKLEDENNLLKLFAKEKFDKVIHLAAQAGVRYSIDNPGAYISSNIVGFANLLEVCRLFSVKHLVFASSSSIYGLNKKVPFVTSDKTDYPISLYGATKKSNELMAHSYSYLFNLPITGLRFFTVYGPWGRPDMAYFLFTEAILKNQPIKVFNKGKLSRDFTYISDIVEGLVEVVNNNAKPMIVPENDSDAPFKIYNIGNQTPVNLLEFIETIEEALGKAAIKEFVEMQAGDVVTTYADVSGLVKDFGYEPNTKLKEGVNAFVEWYKSYYKVKY